MRIIKWIILFVVSVGVGTFIDVNILERIDLNVWLLRDKFEVLTKHVIKLYDVIK